MKNVLRDRGDDRRVEFQLNEGDSTAMWLQLEGEADGAVGGHRSRDTAVEPVRHIDRCIAAVGASTTRDRVMVTRCWSEHARTVGFHVLERS